MADIDDPVYVARPEWLGLEVDDEHCSDLHASLAWEAERATAITILAGYYNPGYVANLLCRVPERPLGRRRNCRIRIGIGIDPSRLITAEWQRLRELKGVLKAAKFGDVQVFAICDGSIHFHTKVYGFVRTTQRAWYVGSANPGQGRHEMMVRVTGRHAALAAYAETALLKGVEVDREPPPEEAGSLSAFFAAGFLAYRPPGHNLLTFDAVHLKRDERKALDEDGGDRADIRFAAVETKGYGFRLAQAMGETELQAADEGQERGIPKRLSHRAKSIETVLGFWVPRPYADEIEASIAEVRTRRLERLERLAEKLCKDSGIKQAKAAFSAYMKDMNGRLRDKKLKERPIEGTGNNFGRWLSARIALLKDHERLDRICRPLVLTPMPGIWDDETATREFIDSFFEDISWRWSSPAGKQRILRALHSGLDDRANLSDPKAARCALEARLAQRPWTDAVWWGEEEDEDDED